MVRVLPALPGRSIKQVVLVLLLILLILLLFHPFLLRHIIDHGGVQRIVRADLRLRFFADELAQEG